MLQLDECELDWLITFARQYVEMADSMAQPSYGVFHGGNPNNFSPDPECSTEKERETHRLACEAWDRGEPVEIPGCEWITDDDGKPVLHLMRAPFGLGTNYDGKAQELCHHVKILLRTIGGPHVS